MILFFEILEIIILILATLYFISVMYKVFTKPELDTRTLIKNGFMRFLIIFTAYIAVHLLHNLYVSKVEKQNTEEISQ